MSGAAREGMLGAVVRACWNARERRPRALVRIGVHALGLAFVLGGASMLGRAFGGGPSSVAIVFGAQSFGVIAVTWLAARMLDRRTLGALGLRPRRGFAVDVAFGTVVGGLSVASIAVVEDVAGWASYALRVADARGAARTVGAIGGAWWVFFGVAISEELVSRGFHLTNLAEGLASSRTGPHPVATLGALALSSIAFGLAHAGNPNATAASVAFVALGGAFLAVGRLTQGDLAVPIGVHLGWNFSQALLDMPVSGLTLWRDAAIVTRVERGPDLFTGGAFGPEAGLTGLFGMAIGTALTLGWIKARTGRLRLLPQFGTPPCSHPDT